MSFWADLPDISVASRRSVQQCAADVLAVLVFENDDLADLTQIDGTARADLARSFESREFRGKLFEVYITRLTGDIPRLVCIGAGPRDKLTIDRVRKVASAAAWTARQRGAGRVAWLVRATGRDALADARAAAEGLVLAALGSDRHKTSPRDAVPLTEGFVVADGGADAAVARGVIDGRATNMARWLSDSPANDLTPTRFGEAALELLGGRGVAVEVMDERRLSEQGMGLILGVGRGSREPPRLIVMRYTAPSGPPDRWLGLVGKGVTFDTGGISIKNAEGMEKMKHDMSGGAAVVAAMSAIAKLNPAISVIGVVPAVENMPDGRAFKPGDILTSAAGKTVEIINTDAEGRLILGDALWFARQQGATHLVDVATLTGACVIALGKVCSGLFGTPDPWIQTVHDAGARVGERYWRLPADDDYVDLLKSDYADMANAGSRAGGAIAGAMFLREFVGGGAWAHLDVAGTAWLDEPKPWQPKGATGITTRALVELATSAESWE